MLAESQVNAPSTTRPFLSVPLLDIERTGAFDDAWSVVGSGRESLAVSVDQARLRRSFLELGERLVETASAPFLDGILGASLFPLLLDIACFETEDRAIAQLEAELRMAFESDPLEDGIAHPAEGIVDDALRSSDSRRAFAWLRAFSLDTTDPGFASTVLRCLGRRRPETPAWRAGIVRSALAADDVEMRDAAVQAAEAWGGPEVLEALGSHREVVPWLHAYIQDVVEDLGE